MAAKIQEALGIQVELIEGSGGVFDVVVNDKMLYSKAITGEFPEEEPLVEHLRTLTK